MYNVSQIKAAVLSKGYKWYDNGKPYNLNIVGVRNDHGSFNTFDDFLTVSCTGVDGKPIYLQMACTTEPGKKWMENPGQSKGTAIMVPGQYPGLWKKGLHKGEYAALVQAAPVKVYRDNNRDDIYDLHPENIESGIIGLNCHHANDKWDSQLVDAWSAACQVVQKFSSFLLVMGYVDKSVELYPNSFTYTLLNSSDIKNG